VQNRGPRFVRAIGLFDGTMIVVGSMIGSGIFIVAADISRQTGSAGGLLLTWILTGLLTISAALSCRRAGRSVSARGRSIHLFARSLLAALGISVWLDAFPGDSIGAIAAVAVGFARYLGRFAAIDISERRDRSPHRPRFEVRDQPFDTTIGWAC